MVFVILDPRAKAKPGMRFEMVSYKHERDRWWWRAWGRAWSWRVETGGWEFISAGGGMEALETAVVTVEPTKDLLIELEVLITQKNQFCKHYENTKW